MFIRFCFSYNFLLNFEIHITFMCIGAAYLLLHNIVPILYSSTIFLGTYMYLYYKRSGRWRFESCAHYGRIFQCHGPRQLILICI